MDQWIKKSDLESDRVNLLKEAEEFHRKWLAALGAVDYIDYQLKKIPVEEKGA